MSINQPAGMEYAKWPPGKRERLHDLLGGLGNSVIDVETFWRHMRQAGLGDEDIDRYCDEECVWLPDDGAVMTSDQKGKPPF